MQALAFDRYGDASVLGWRELPQPQPGPGQVKVQVEAVGLNVIDNRVRAGYFGFPMVNRRFPKVPGADFAGVVAAVGQGVTDLKPGDAVFGATDPFRGGALAEFVVAPAQQLALRPAGLSVAEAASLPVAGSAALQSLRDLALARAGQSVLVLGASGAVGLFAVQMARELGLEVTAVAGAAARESLLKLGAHRVLDYRRETPQGQWDIVLDLSSQWPFSKARALLKLQGRFVQSSPGLPSILEGKLRNPWRGQQHLPLMTRLQRSDLQALAAQAVAGDLQVVVAARYPWVQAAKALADFERGGAIGKVVVLAAGGAAE